MNTDPDRMNHQPPYHLVMVVCDQIVMDPSTKKRTLFGIFDEIGATAVPAIHPRMSVYVTLTDGRGSTPFTFRLVDVDEEREPIFEVEDSVEFRDPLQIRHLEFHFQNVTFPAFGEYRFQLIFDGDMIERRIIVRDIGETRQ
ncbi:MAG: hypothetical protein WD066_07125 [Planctomycetaceae bacterium]